MNKIFINKHIFLLEFHLPEMQQYIEKKDNYYDFIVDNTSNTPLENAKIIYDKVFV
jgi:hypothetical protein